MRFRALIAALGVLFFYVPGVAASPDPDTLRIALAATPNTLSPVVRTTQIEGFITTTIFDPLVDALPDGTMRPMLAAAVPTVENGGISRDGRTITYHLRHGVRWHDGAEFTSRDVAFSQRAVTDPANNVTLRDPYRSIADVRTPDDFTVIVRLKAVYAPFVAEWFTSIGIIPAHLLATQKELNDVPFNASPVGTGPFIFDHWDRGHEIVVRANDDYFLGKPKLKRIVFALMGQENSRNIALRTGETDWSFAPAPASVRELAGVDGIVAVALASNAFFGDADSNAPPAAGRRPCAPRRRIRNRPAIDGSQGRRRFKDCNVGSWTR